MRPPSSDFIAPAEAYPLDALATPVAWSGADGRIVGVNPALARWLSVSPKRLPGLPLAALEVEGARLAEALAAPPEDDDLRLRARDDGHRARSDCRRNEILAIDGRALERAIAVELSEKFAGQTIAPLHEHLKNEASARASGAR